MKKSIFILTQFIFILIEVLILALYIFFTNKPSSETTTASTQQALEIVNMGDTSPTQEIPEIAPDEEISLEEQETEDESFEYQGNIAYESGETAQDKVILGPYQGLTYYSQVDNRWKNHLYTSTGSASQTIGTSGCGPTAAAIVVSSIKGAITPEAMGDLYVAHNYRSPNNGTYWSAFRWTADFFDIEYKETTSLQTALDFLDDNYYIIASCGSGLFTYGGHFVVLVGRSGNTLQIYDPYLYNGKYDVSTRRGKASVSGINCYVTVDNFRTYANYRTLFAFKNNNTKSSTQTSLPDSQNNSSSFTTKITTKAGLNIRSGPGTNYSKIGAYKYGTTVTILEQKDGFGKTDKGWISLDYTSNSNSGNSNVSNVGEIKFFKDYTIIYSNPNLTGTKYNYLANTSVEILEHVSDSIDKVKSRETGRIGYINTSNYK